MVLERAHEGRAGVKLGHEGGHEERARHGSNRLQNRTLGQCVEIHGGVYDQKLG